MMAAILTLALLSGIIFLVCLAFVGRDAERDLHLPEPDYERKFRGKQ